MKRRGFLGIMGGAVVAGPGAAKQAVTAASRASTGGVASLMSSSILGEGPDAEADSVGITTHKDYLLERVSRYQRVLSGQLTEEEIQERNLRNETHRVRFEIETSGLRSMAETSKYARMSRYAQQQKDERERFYAKRNLKEYLKELAGMGS